MLQADLPDRLKEVRIATDLNLKSLEPAWEIGYLTLKGSANAEVIAKSVKGYVDTIGGKNVVWSPRQAYLVPMENNVVGIVRPSDRRMVGMWLNKESSGGSTSYLKSHADQATKFISLMLAVDLQNLWSPIAMEKRVETFTSVKGLDLKAVAATLSSVHGIRIIVGRKNLDECIISLDFGSSPSYLLPIAKELFQEVLERNNTSVSEASKWAVSMDGNTLAFRGTISAATIDQLLGIFTLHEQASAIPSTASELEPLQDPTSESALMALNKNYFAKSTDIISRVRDYSAQNTGARAQWNGVMARRLDDLPTLNVDPELVDFSVRVAQGLRGNMVAMQQTNIKVGAAAVINGVGGSQVSYGYRGGYGGYGYYNNNSNSSGDYQAIGAAQGNYSFRQLMAEIDAMEGDIKRKMTAKYKVQF